MDIAVMGHVILMGDVNADLTHPMDYPGRTLLETLEIIDAEEIVPIPTRVAKSSATCIDIIATPRILTRLSYSVKPIAASDHFPVVASVLAQALPQTRPVKKRS